MRFEQIEALIRRDAGGTTSFGFEFEWLCKWLLETAPCYRGQFDKVWLWKDWPDRWKGLSGIDLVARTRGGELWAIQAKAYRSDRPINKPEIDKFLSDSARAEFAHRLLMGTTDHIGRTARETINGQDKPVTLFLRGDFLTAEVQWPVRIKGTGARLPPWPVKPHQTAAIEAVVNGFRDHDRGRLIMACGTGKTLTSLRINEALGSRRTLLLVPSISLAQQSLKDWGRHAKEDFDCLVVCSDETVASDRHDPALRYAADLSIKPTTNPDEIAAFLAKRRSRPALVISTYQSCERVSRGQAKAMKWFDLAICDEAHRVVGHAESQFATVLHDKKIRARRRLFMTATPRYFTPRAKQRGVEQDIELVSMDDETKFGPEFHVLTFHEAITAKPKPLLTDYQVVVIGVTNAEAKAWVADAKLIRTKDGLETDARTLAAQIGLAKAIKQYDLRKMITFHRSIPRASRFVDGERRDSLPAVIEKMRPANRPAGQLWARHVSGKTAASKRASLLKELGDLQTGTRGLISNCACLGEGVDVPALDGVAFIDPKGSIVDIIQAVGRVIRKSPDKKIGTIVIPVFVDESEDADHALENSAFDPVWQVLKALRAHDRRLADELDQLRTSLGGQTGGGKRIKLPANIVLDVPRCLLKDFEQAFVVRTVNRTTEAPNLTIDQVLAYIDTFYERYGKWPMVTSEPVDGMTFGWKSLDSYLRAGLRGLPSGLSVANVLEKYRGVQNIYNQRPLTVKWIVKEMRRHNELTGHYPTQASGKIHLTGETWAGVEIALARCIRGIEEKSSIAKLREQYLGVTNKKNQPPLSLDWVEEQIRRFYRDTAQFPSQESGAIPDSAETWSRVHGALYSGSRGIKRKVSLSTLVREVLGVKVSFTSQDIETWVRAYQLEHNKFPSQKTGDIPGTPFNWRQVDYALYYGFPGRRGDQSLSQFISERFGVKNRSAPPKLTLKQICADIDCYFRRHRTWPTATSGKVSGKDETFQSYAMALWRGSRGLKKKSFGQVVKLCRQRYERRASR